MSGFGFPYRIGRDGMTAGADEEAHVREMIEQVLFTRRGERVSMCANPACRLVFVDDSRNGSRRWCDNAGCGNRVRVRRYRATHDEVHASSR